MKLKINTENSIMQSTGMTNFSNKQNASKSVSIDSSSTKLTNF